MFDLLIRYGVDFMYKYGNISEDKREEYTYGLELIITYLFNAGSLLLLSLIFNRFLETLLVLIGFALLQSFAGGYHATTHLRCALLMLAGWVVIMLLIPYVTVNRILLFLLAVFGLFFIFKLAPVKHVNYPISMQKEQKMQRVARTVAISLFIFVFVCSIPFLNAELFASVFSITLFMSAISIICAILKEAYVKKY